MTARQVRHRKKEIRYRGRKLVLNDPLALGHFFDKLVKFAIHSIKVNLKKMKFKYARQMKTKLRDLKIIKLW